MKEFTRNAALMFTVLHIVAPVWADDPCGTDTDPGDRTWSVEWTDKFGETTYALMAPCRVLVGVPFIVSATVVDRAYPSAAVGWNWVIREKAKGGGSVTVAAGGEDWVWLDRNGQWTHEITMTSAGSPGKHVIEFSFVDFGHGSGSHSLDGSVIGAVSVDRD
jgi:hypothetical protein